MHSCAAVVGVRLVVVVRGRLVVVETSTVGLAVDSVVMDGVIIGMDVVVVVA